MQRLYKYLFPEHVKILKEVEKLIIELGGQPILPKFGWKRSTLQRLFGWEMAKNIAAASHKLGLSLAAKWDEILYKIF